MVVAHCKYNLHLLKGLVSTLTQEQYVYVSQCLEGGSIGQHLRHILEFYACLIEGVGIGKVNYDRRKRDLRISTSRLFAIEHIEELMSELNEIPLDCSIILEGQFDVDDSEWTETPTSVQRELIYCLEHSIHHQALIRVVLQELGLIQLVDIHFGIASSTVRFHQGVPAK
jgi:uncharacterized damage-inducible protein DinB